MKYKLTENGVIMNGRVHIPASRDNRHWLEYLAWLSNGNTPDPVDPADLGPVAGEPPINAEELYDMLKAKGVVMDADRPRQRS